MEFLLRLNKDEETTIIMIKANLKRTSLNDLALRAGIDDSRAFVQHFIDYDRMVRE